MMDILISLFLILGSLFIMLAALGILKFPDLYLRMHASSKAVSFGSGLMLIAAVLYFKDWFVSVEAVLIITFIFITTPVASHMISRAAYLLKVPLWEKTVVDELNGKSIFKQEFSSNQQTDEKAI
jgi:multicomponent Na+:H+ antiporter subunit G